MSPPARASRLRGRFARCGLAVLMLVLPVPAGGEEPAGPPTESREDWPAIIAQLRHRLYQQPGQGNIRRQLATAYNNYGVALGQEREWDSAIRQLQEAITLDETSAQFRNNLSVIYVNQAVETYKAGQAPAALDLLDKAVRLQPGLADAYVLRGEIEYNRQKLKEAQAAWKRALELDPNRTELAGKLAQVTQELPIESKFERLSQSYFDIRYEERAAGPAGFDVRSILLEARREVGSDFAHWPKGKLVVLLYSAESFSALRQETPDWVAGQYDGKIRVPLPDTTMPLATVRQILFHEYTHAVIQELTEGRCPLWLNEGLAEYEGRSQAAAPLNRLKAAHAAQQLIPWTGLSAHFSMQLSQAEVGLAYEQSYALCAYLAHRYGFWRIRRLLKAVALGEPWEEVIAKELHTKLARIERDWLAWLPELL